MVHRLTACAQAHACAYHTCASTLALFLCGAAEQHVFMLPPAQIYARLCIVPSQTALKRTHPSPWHIDSPV